MFSDSIAAYSYDSEDALESIGSPLHGSASCSSPASLAQHPQFVTHCCRWPGTESSCVLRARLHSATLLVTAPTRLFPTGTSPRQFPQQQQCQDQGHTVAHASLVPSILDLFKRPIYRQRINLL